MAADSTPQLADLQHIRQLMDRNTRFLSLSGLSGIGVGIVALLGTGFLFWLSATEPSWVDDIPHFVAVLATATLMLSVVVAWFFTSRRMRREGGNRTLTSAAKRMLLALALPLLVGGVFCAYLYSFEMFGLLYWPPVMLCSYGLGLAACAQFTHHELYWLGLSDIMLGFIALFWQEYGLLCWALGFGLLHIIYGAWMYWKYERNAA